LTVARESKKAKRARAEEVYRILEVEYPDAHCALDHRNPYELTVATILSAQCTDARVNMVTPRLFQEYPSPEDLAGARQEDVEEIVHSTGFYRNKARNLIGMAEKVVERHQGRIPRTLKELVKLPGIGRKTANVVLGNAFGLDEGVVVDTHVKRISNRLKFTRHKAPVKVERDLMELFPRERWTMLAHLMIFHGRAICDARKPLCGQCPVAHLCPSAQS
jgi:endonuclease III